MQAPLYRPDRGCGGRATLYGRSLFRVERTDFHRPIGFAARTERVETAVLAVLQLSF
jgi:hypothetical protein